MEIQNNKPLVCFSLGLINQISDQERKDKALPNLMSKLVENGAELCFITIANDLSETVIIVLEKSSIELRECRLKFRKYTKEAYIELAVDTGREIGNIYAVCNDKDSADAANQAGAHGIYSETVNDMAEKLKHMFFYK